MAVCFYTGARPSHTGQSRQHTALGGALSSGSAGVAHGPALRWTVAGRSCGSTQCSRRRSAALSASSLQPLAQGSAAPSPLPQQLPSPALNPDPYPAAAAAKRVGVGRLGWGLVACVALCACLGPSAHAAAAAATAAGSTGSFSLPGAVRGLLDFALHLDTHLSAIIAQHGRSTYGILFAIVFAETGLVLTPFLPGDSLLFAAGAFAALGSLHAPTLLATFITAAILGDAVNYAVGHFLGARAVNSGIIKREYLAKTEAFYAKYGGKTVVLARFVPIIRTFAPFVAGVGNMEYSKFAGYNVGGAVLWSVLFVGAGYFFGNLPFVQHNFTLVVLAIVLVSVLPIAFELLAARREQQPDLQ